MPTSAAAGTGDDRRRPRVAQPQGASGTGVGYGPELLDEVTLT